jgi:hypothetical protein
VTLSLHALIFTHIEFSLIHYYTSIHGTFSRGWGFRHGVLWVNLPSKQSKTIYNTRKSPSKQEQYSKKRNTTKIQIFPKLVKLVQQCNQAIGTRSHSWRRNPSRIIFQTNSNLPFVRATPLDQNKKPHSPHLKSSLYPKTNTRNFRNSNVYIR